MSDHQIAYQSQRARYKALNHHGKVRVAKAIAEWAVKNIPDLRSDPFAAKRVYSLCLTGVYLPIDYGVDALTEEEIARW